MSLYAYEKLITEHKLKQSDLPEEVQIAILGLQDISRGSLLQSQRAQKAGKVYTISPVSKKKIEQLDKWACRGILEHLDGDIIDEPVPHTIVELKKDIDNKSHTAVVTTARAVNVELADLFNAGNVEIGLNVLATEAPSCHKLISSTYEKDGENGIETGQYSLLEVKDGIFKLEKK